MLLWADIETTGLNPREDVILEIAAIATDDALNEVARFHQTFYFESAATIAGLAVAGFSPEEISKREHLYRSRNFGPRRIDPYVIAMHLKNGLWLDCAKADPILSPSSAFVAFIQEHATREVEYVDEKDGQTKKRVERPQLAGSTISFDREFLGCHMPDVVACLNHRNVDVSTFNETARRFWPELHKARPQAKEEDKAHRGMKDIEESIRVYKHYLERLAPVTVAEDKGARDVNWDRGML